MAELRPYPFDALVRRCFSELRTQGSIFQLPRAKFFAGSAGTISPCPSTGASAPPFGPAAGPHTQMAQNIVLSWLGGSRIIELKTVQINDELDDPAPLHRHADGRLQRRVVAGAASSSSRSRSTSRARC